MIDARPSFPSLEPWADLPRLTLPAQVSRGCPYGLCTFCTYPAVEGSYRVAPELGHTSHVFDRAARTGGVVSFKDSLLREDVLSAIAEVAAARVEWSGCTKLGKSLLNQLPLLARAGCRTLELGVETIDPQSQRSILKRHEHRDLEHVLETAGEHGVRLVLNYMTGLPGEDPSRSAGGLAKVRALAAAHGAVVEHHILELERRAPLAANADFESWPWASVVRLRSAATAASNTAA